jgi:hypothetical protein
MYLLRNKNRETIKTENRMQRRRPGVWRGCRESTEMAACTKPPRARQLSLHWTMSGCRSGCAENDGRSTSKQKGNNRGRRLKALVLAGEDLKLCSRGKEERTDTPLWCREINNLRNPLTPAVEDTVSCYCCRRPCHGI